MKIWIVLYYNLLFFLFLAGVALIVFSKKQNQDILDPFKKGLIGIFFIHVFLYTLMGAMNVPFGWQRNFFYLLPIYFLVIFYFLKRTINHRFFYYVVSSILLILSLYFSVEKCFEWQQVNLLREMVLLAQQNQQDSLIISKRGIDRWPFSYYAKKYGIDQRALFLPAFDAKIESAEIIQKLSNKEEFVVIEPFSKDILRKLDKNGVLNPFKIEKVRNVSIEIGPYAFLRRIIGNGPQRVFEYYYSKQSNVETKPTAP